MKSSKTIIISLRIKSFMSVTSTMTRAYPLCS